MPSTIEKYIWFINQLIDGQHKEFQSLQEGFRSFMDRSGEYGILNERTEREWKNKIRSIFNIDIRCDNYNRRYIHNLEQLTSNSAQHWLLQTLSLEKAIRDCLKDEKIQDKILLETIPSGETHLNTVLSAIKANEQIVVRYHSFRTDSVEREIIMRPLALKMFQRRWYLLSWDSSDTFVAYSLDRIISISFTNKKFTRPKGFDAEQFFNQFYGVFVNSDQQKEIIRIKVFGNERNYMNSLPLHHTQKEIAHAETYSIFEFFLPPTKDFIMDILRLGSNVEVIEPKSLREEITAEIQSMRRLYSTKK